METDRRELYTAENSKLLGTLHHCGGGGGGDEGRDSECSNVCHMPGPSYLLHWWCLCTCVCTYVQPTFGVYITHVVRMSQDIYIYLLSSCQLHVHI